MSLVDSEAIILRTVPLGEADKLVSFLARGFGRLRGVARGARRPRNRWGAALEPLSHVQLWFFDHEHRELLRLSQGELIECFWQSQGDYTRTVALNHIAELCERLLPERQPSERTFRLILMVLAALKGGSELWLPLCYFHIWMVRLAGILPLLNRCNECERELHHEPGYVSIARPVMLCRHCRRPDMHALSEASRRLALELLVHPLSRLDSTPCTKGQMADLRNYLLDVIEYHTERKLLTRELLDGLE